MARRKPANKRMATTELPIYKPASDPDTIRQGLEEGWIQPHFNPAQPWTYIPNFLDQEQADRLLEYSQGLNWQQNSIKMFGKPTQLPRLESIYGDGDYSYNGLTLKAAPWTEELQDLRVALEKISGYKFQIAIGNQYRDGNDHIGWHADDSPEMGERPAIASLSLGATRKFQLRHKRTKEVHSFELEHGSLFVMHPGCQEDWQHRICKKTGGELRINWTFRPLQSVAIATPTTTEDLPPAAEPGTLQVGDRVFSCVNDERFLCNGNLYFYGWVQRFDKLGIWVQFDQNDPEIRNLVAPAALEKFDFTEGDRVQGYWDGEVREGRIVTIGRTKIQIDSDGAATFIEAATATLLEPASNLIEPEPRSKPSEPNSEQYNVGDRVVCNDSAGKFAGQTGVIDSPIRKNGSVTVVMDNGGRRNSFQVSKLSRAALSPQPSAPTRQILPLKQIRRDRKLQQRAAGIDRPTVQDYQESLAEGAALPPPKVKFDGEQYWLFDGYHTFSAALANGLTELEFEVSPGTFEDAEWDSCAANKDHGLQRKLGDKQKAVCTALRLHPEMSDRAIAKHCKVSADMVGDWRAILAGNLPRRKRDPGVSPNGHTLDELIELYAPLGKFRLTDDSKFRYELERSNGSSWFRGLDEAYDLFGEMSRRYSHLANSNAAATERPASPVGGSVPFAYTPQPETGDSGGDVAAVDAPSETAVEETAVAESQPEPAAEVSDPTPPPESSRKKNERIAHDYYPTPVEIVGALLRHVTIAGQVIDPASGQNAIADKFYGAITNEPYPAEGITPDYCADATDPGFWRQVDRDGGFDWAVANPPYTGDLPVEILKHSFTHARVGVAFLLRLSFLEPCENRVQWLQENADHLVKIISLNPRPKFRVDVSGRDQLTVAWHVFRKDWSWKAKGIPCPFVFENWKDDSAA